MNRPSVHGVANIVHDASATTKLGRVNVILTNSGAKTLYLRLNQDGATVSDFPLVSGATRQLTASYGRVIYSVAAICGGADDTTLDYLAWD